MNFAEDACMMAGAFIGAFIGICIMALTVHGLPSPFTVWWGLPLTMILVGMLIILAFIGGFIGKRVAKLLGFVK